MGKERVGGPDKTCRAAAQDNRTSGAGGGWKVGASSWAGDMGGGGGGPLAGAAGGAGGARGGAGGAAGGAAKGGGPAIVMW